MTISFIFMINLVSSAACFPDYECGEWSNCFEDLKSRTCVDKKCGMQNITEREFCFEKGCKPNIQCTEWTNCFFTEKINDILKGESRFIGYKERTCSDLSGCISPSFESTSCVLSAPIKIKKTIWCNEEYVEIFDDETQAFVGRIKKAEIKDNPRKNRVDISFATTGNSSYCDYCFDDVKNNDEVNVDCGGACPSCIESVVYFDWLFWVIISSWFLFGILLFFSVGKKVFEFFYSKPSSGGRLKWFLGQAKFGSIEEKNIDRKIEGWFSNLFTKSEKVFESSSL